jgi:hypothetical protein
MKIAVACVHRPAGAEHDLVHREHDRAEDGVAAQVGDEHAGRDPDAVPAAEDVVDRHAGETDQQHLGVDQDDGRIVDPEHRREDRVDRREVVTELRVALDRHVRPAAVRPSLHRLVEDAEVAGTHLEGEELRTRPPGIDVQGDQHDPRTWRQSCLDRILSDSRHEGGT